MKAKPKQLAHPEIPYDQVAIQLNMSPVFKADDYVTAVNMRVIPYRALPDGTLDKSEALAVSFTSADVAADAASDPAMATAIAKIGAALQEWVEAKEL